MSPNLYDSTDFTTLRREQCPKCAEEGRDTTGDNLHVRLHIPTQREMKHCFACGYTDSGRDSIGGVKQPGRPLIKEPFVDNVAAKYRMTIDGNVLYFGYATPDGILKRYKVRDYNLPKQHRDHFRWDKKGECTLLYGMDTCSNTNGILILTFGEKDAPAAHILTDGWNAVSLPNGDAGWERPLKANYSWLMQFKTILIAGDNDEPAQRTALAIKEFLGFRAKVVSLPAYTINLEDGAVTLKDPFDYLNHGFKKEFTDAIKAAYTKTEDYTYDTEELISRIGVYLDGPTSHPIYSGIAELDALCPMYRHQFTLLFGAPGKGKSTFVRSILKSIIEQGVRPYFISYEESVEETIMKLIPPILGEPIYYDAAGTITNTKSDILDKVYRLTHVMDIAKVPEGRKLDHVYLSETLEYAYVARGCQFVALDHITWLADMSSNPIMDIKIMVHAVGDIVKKYPMHVLVVSHNKRPTYDPKQDRNHKRKSDWEELEEPTLRDTLYGSGLEQIAFNIWSLKSPDNEPMRLFVLKNRKRGKKGMGRVYLYFLPDTYEIVGISRYEKSTKSQRKSNSSRWDSGTVRQQHRETAFGAVLPPSEAVRHNTGSVPTEDVEEE